MTPLEALEFLFNLTGNIPLTRAQHANVTNAVATVKDALTRPTTPTPPQE